MTSLAQQDEEQRERGACDECGSWGPCRDSCPLVTEQADREGDAIHSAINAARLALLADVAARRGVS